jgi:hypothetical protein
MSAYPNLTVAFKRIKNEKQSTSILTTDIKQNSISEYMEYVVWCVFLIINHNPINLQIEVIKQQAKI